MKPTANDAETIDGLLRRGAELWPDREFIMLEDGTSWTWSQALEEGQRAAGALAAQGVTSSGRVMVLLGNGPDWLRTWWGTALLGATFVSVNPAYKGQLLADACETIEPEVIVTDPAHVALLTESSRGAVLAPEALSQGATPGAEVMLEAHPSDVHCLLMTSGTTGPSKASVTTHAYVVNLAAWLVDESGLDENDVFLADMPWFHLSAFAPAVQVMRVGGRIAVRNAPSMTTYWRTAKVLGATFAIAPGTVAQFLLAQPATDSDRDHRMRFLLCSPLPPDPEAFTERFGLDGLCTAYGSTEANLSVVSSLQTPIRQGSCGRARAGFQIRIVDEHDYEVPTGEVGELIVRADQPWLQSQGYLRTAEATVRAWRNGWFHSGDALRVDEDGYYFFHDRYKDGLRRRGENISSYEVEREVLAYQGVAEVACIAHPGDYGGDDEVKVFIVQTSATSIDFEKLLTFLVDRMPYFMIPRFYETIDNLPKTPTQRVQKHLLRERGNSVATWDREAQGFKVTRHGLISQSK
jgi:crotonobetaine/carnitine-CoA ligase